MPPFEVAATFLRGFFSGTARQRSRRLVKAPLGAVQVSALRHPDPSVGKECLSFLDHYANDQSMAVFGAGLEDPVDFVSNVALPSLVCTSCTAQAVDTADVVAGLVQVISSDPCSDLRVRAMSMLFYLASGDGAARAALEVVATGDPDQLIRRAAAGALEGRFVAPRKRYQRHQRTHAVMARRTGS